MAIDVAIEGASLSARFDSHPSMYSKKKKPLVKFVKFNKNDIFITIKKMI